MASRVETSLLVTGEDALIQIGLQHWKGLWPSRTRDEELTRLTPDDVYGYAWKRMGFTRYAPEYWLLTHLALDRMRSRETERASIIDPPEVKCEDADMAQLDALITEFRDLPLILV